jgi:hypothetical protein
VCVCVSVYACVCVCMCVRVCVGASLSPSFHPFLLKLSHIFASTQSNHPFFFISFRFFLSYFDILLLNKQTDNNSEHNNNDIAFLVVNIPTHNLIDMIIRGSSTW